MRKLPFVASIMALLVAVGLVSCQPAKQPKEEYPMFWTWLDYRAGMNFDSICQVMNDMGIDGVMLNAPTPDDYRVAIPVAHRHGIEVYAWLWTMNLEHDRDRILKEHPEWLSVNRNGKSLADTTAYVGYYKFLCPTLPEVREYINEKIKAYCEVDGLNGIAIDYHRLVDVVLPTTLWPTYGIVQDREYAAWDYGYHPEMLRKFEEQYGYDPRKQEDPSLDEKWRQFRCDQVTEVANLIAETVHSYGKKMAASPFPTPKMASRMVRQDWSRWNLDIVFPMVYHNFYTEDVSFIADCTVENARDKQPMTTLYCGMMATDGPEMFQQMGAAFGNGAQGIAIFTMNGLRQPEVKRQFKAYADSMRALRAEMGGTVPCRALPAAADPDPFCHKGVMRLIERRMCQLIAGEGADSQAVQLKLGDYRPTDAYDATRSYEVADANSGALFKVTFYQYGDVLSGWNVERIK
ncbi:MAG: family 10 glycosylhydrolase [Bacteroidales bacterium]|nr:family 10 glycosylhydrolase [Bacteroidales bacterium]